VTDVRHIGAERARRGRGPVAPVAAVPDDDDDDGLRGEVLEVVREQLREGRYCPPADAVAEQLVAWLFAGDVAQAS
jgi:hypothetical protein